MRRSHAPSRAAPAPMNNNTVMICGAPAGEHVQMDVPAVTQDSAMYQVTQRYLSQQQHAKQQQQHIEPKVVVSDDYTYEPDVITVNEG